MITIIRSTVATKEETGRWGPIKSFFWVLSWPDRREEARLISGLQKRFNLSPEKAERLLQRVPIVVKKGVSTAEMERYVRAFKEIGGKVRVEEEPVTEAEEIPGPPPGPEPGYGSGPEPEPQRKSEKRAYAGAAMTCPHCGFEQPEAAECVKCGIIISKYQQYQEMARSYEGKVREISSEDVSSPWESGEGFLWAFLRTTREVLFSPTTFFRKVAKGEGYWSPLIYGVICGLIGAGGAVLWQWLLFSRIVPLRIFSAIPFLSLFLTGLVIAFPLMVAFSILVGSGVTQLCLMIVGGNKRGFESTFRVIAYSFSGHLFRDHPLHRDQHRRRLRPCLDHPRSEGVPRDFNGKSGLGRSSSDHCGGWARHPHGGAPAPVPGPEILRRSGGLDNQSEEV